MDKYNWTFTSVGGTVRVKITSGADIAHLGELDRKLWTVLSCPAKNLEFDQKTLELIDKGDPVKAAREKTSLRPGEMIYKATILSDRHVIVTMTPEEFLFRGRILEYTPSSTQRKDETP